MTDGAATSGKESIAGSLDSQQTMEYSLDNVNGTPPEVSRPQEHENDKNNPTDVKLKDQEEHMDTDGRADLQNQKQTEQEQGICTDSNEKDETPKDGNVQVGEGNSASNSDSPEQVDKTENSDQIEKVNEGDNVHQMNEEGNRDSLKSMDREKSPACDQDNEEVKCVPQNEQNNPVVCESQDESMELGEDKGMKVNRDEDTGQSQTSLSSKEHVSGLVQEESNSSDSSDDDHWGRPWASKDTQMYRSGYPVSQVKLCNVVFVDDLFVCVYPGQTGQPCPQPQL